jgi:hypothetical protein
VGSNMGIFDIFKVEVLLITHISKEYPLPQALIYCMRMSQHGKYNILTNKSVHIILSVC